MIPFEIQPTLEGKTILARPLQVDDFESLFALACDPLVWEQHPNPNRYKLEEFQNYFTGAIESGGALLVVDKQNGNTIGCSRFYDWNPEQRTITIGYTFIGRAYWGKGKNPELKNLMLQHAFRFVDAVHFHIGAVNKRSQIAIERLGAVKIAEKQVAYYGEQSNLNFIYEIKKGVNM